MDEGVQVMILSHAKSIWEKNMWKKELEELDAAAYKLSAHNNRKERRAFEARQRKRK